LEPDGRTTSSPALRPHNARPMGDDGVMTVTSTPSTSTSVPPAQGATRYHVADRPCPTQARDPSDTTAPAAGTRCDHPRNTDNARSASAA